MKTRNLNQRHEIESWWQFWRLRNVETNYCLFFSLLFLFVFDRCFSHLVPVQVARYTSWHSVKHLRTLATNKRTNWLKKKTAKIRSETSNFSTLETSQGSSYRGRILVLFIRVFICKDWWCDFSSGAHEQELGVDHFSTRSICRTCLKAPLRQ